MSNSNATDFNLEFLKTSNNLNSSTPSSSSSSGSSSFLSSSYPSPPPRSTSPPFINSEPTTPTVVNHPTRVTSTFAEARTRSIVKAKRSLVWRYFKSIHNDSFNVECIICSSVVLRKTTSTSNLLYHLQIHHNLEYSNLNKSMKAQARQSDLSGRLPLTSDRALYLNKLIANLIVHNFIPLSILESPHLKEIFHEVEPSYIIPVRKYFVNNVLKHMYEEVREKVYAELQASCGIHTDASFGFICVFVYLGICLTTDIWTSDANQAYMTVTAHFIDIQNKKAKIFVLDTKEFYGSHTAERIVERLDEICDVWSISDKVICLISDTCNTMKKVGQTFGKGWYL